MSQKPQKIDHVGTFVRQQVIPIGMSVKDAAKQLGVGRPALSNLLNGNSSLSSDMAVRLEKAFGANRQKLLELQAKFDRDDRREEEKTVAVRAYVPNFLTIKALQIHNWAECNLEARNLLPVLLRKLVHSTGDELRHVDFPGYDNAERRGWDGLIEAGAATPWIPEGKSCWEFGANKNPSAKSETDYAARLNSVPFSERAEITFVFVTPRNWPGKAEWAKAKNANGDWKAVKAFDASDLEQWLEVSIPAQIWLAENLNFPVPGFETLDQFWQRWSAASDPHISPEIFEPSIIAYRDTFKAWLEKESERPFVVAADSKDEALAFIACLFQDSAIATQWKDLTAVFESAQTLRTLAASSSPFIPIASTEEAERELAPLYRKLHCIFVRHRNSLNTEPDISLDLLGYEAFEKALASMGLESDEAARLSRESGRSPTILRRRLSKIDAIRTPQWAGEVAIAKTLIPITLIGAWHAKSLADCEVVSNFADRPYQEIEESIARLLQFDDCPVWSAGQYRGVASKIDALFAINKQVTEKHLKDFFLIAKNVLSEIDPALDLPEDQRWVAGLYGKVRNHSAALREGICETLVILSVHGNNLFLDRLGMDVEACVSCLIRELLTPLSIDKLLSQDNDLPHYAEAAPDKFLTLLEADLQQPEPVMLGLLKPASGIFGGCPRTGLLWALECLAWNRQNLPRVSVVLAQLSRTKIDDNWMNKPISSLAAIFRSWMPQTAASLEDRTKTLEMLTERYPDIAWQICIQQFGTGLRTGFYSYRPHWRSDASGAGQMVSGEEMFEFTRKALDLALAWPKQNEKTLGDLVERLDGMPDEDQATVWNLIDVWAGAETDDKVKAVLREQIRKFAFTRRGRRRGLKEATRDRAREAYAKLQARDPVIRHAWLFSNHWIDLSSDEIEDEDLDYSKREERINRIRINAMKEILKECGFGGVMTLLSNGCAAHTIGHYLASCIKGKKAKIDFLRRGFSTYGDLEGAADRCLQNFIQSVDDKARNEMLSAVAKDMDVEQIVRLFRTAPFGGETWRLLDRYSDEIRDRYWREVYPYWNRHTEAELIEVVDRLLEAKRPRAAFEAVHVDWSKIETSRLKRLLLAVTTSNMEPADLFNLKGYHISAALKSLDGRTGVSPDEMAQLEFLYIKALDHSEHGIPNLERQIADSPAIFVQALALAYRRSDDGQDPPEWRIDDPEQRAGVASAAHDLLDRITRIPGTGYDGKINEQVLLTWVTDVRRLCFDYGRAEIGDQIIGRLLSSTPAEEDGVWPCLPVCEVMERIGSQQIATGFRLGVYNSRGMHVRGEGGMQERALAAKYRGWAKNLVFDYPYVGGVLENIAANYDRDAGREDSEAKVRKRLRY